MIKLLTNGENFADCFTVYNENYSAFTVKGKPKGETKQSGIEWNSREDYQSLQMLFHMLGLSDYIEMELHEGMLYMRVNRESEAE